MAQTVMPPQDPNQPSLEQIAAELKLRLLQYPQVSWGKKQTDDWDRRTNFIYRVARWEELRRRIERLEPKLAHYAVHRWFNFWSAMAIEQMFCAMPGVTPHLNQQDRLVDFSIRGITFDHKTSVFPKNYPKSPKFAYHNKAHLITWLYRNQSRQQRYHRANRLFVILYARDGLHWRLRADINGLSRTVAYYVAHFDQERLIKLDDGPRTVYSDILWHVR